MQALSQLSYGPTSLRSEIIAVPPGVGKRFVALFFTQRAWWCSCVFRMPGSSCVDAEAKGSAVFPGQGGQDRALVERAMSGAGIDQLGERAMHALQLRHP